MNFADLFLGYENFEKLFENLNPKILKMKFKN